MKKIVSYVVVAAIILLAALVSCEKDNKRPNDDKCICMLVNTIVRYKIHSFTRQLSRNYIVL